MGKKLYIGNLPFSISEQTLMDSFSKAGAVETVSIITDRETGRSKGFGFVEMATDDAAQKAIEQLNGTQLDGRSITVNEARPQAPRESRGGGRDNFYGQSRGGRNSY